MMLGAAVLTEAEVVSRRTGRDTRQGAIKERPVLISGSVPAKGLLAFSLEAVPRSRQDPVREISSLVIDFIAEGEVRGQRLDSRCVPGEGRLVS